ncbi:MAG: DUF983 domain-containing protein [Candidatus Xenobia bacterium]
MNWIQALWDGLRGRCPNCHQGRICKTLIEPYENCPGCGVTFQPYEGDFLGALAIGYTITATAALVGFLVLSHFVQLSAVVNIALWGAFALVFYIVLYPNLKGIWVALLYLMTGLRPL